MRLITIEIEYEKITVKEGRLDGARREWTVTGQMDIFIKGAFDKLAYDQAANLACNVAQGMNIPLTMLRRVWSANTRSMTVHPKQAKLL